MKKNRIIVLVLGCFGMAFIASSFTGDGGVGRKSNGAPPYNTNAPGEKNCSGAEGGSNSCHSGGAAANSGPGVPKIMFSGTNNQYVPGQTYTITFEVNQASKQRFGFQGVILRNSNNKNIGDIIITQPNRTKKRQATWGSEQDRWWVNQLIGGTAPVSAGKGQWKINWKAPSSNVGDITIYGGFLASNNNGVNDPGDLTYYTNLKISPAPAPQYDAGITQVSEPATNNCGTSYTPKVMIKNYGTTTINSLTVYYSVDGGSAMQQPWSGSLGGGNSTSFNLSTLTSSGGSHTILVWTDKPNGANDANPLNDNTSKSFNVVLPPSVSPLVTNISCNGADDGRIDATVSGPNGPYNYSWAMPPNPTTPIISNVMAGSHSVTVTDKFGCSTTASGINVTEPNAVIATTVSTNSTCGTCNDGTINVSPSGGTNPYTYQWNDALSQTTSKAIGLGQGTYCVTVTDKNGCTFTICDSVDFFTGLLTNDLYEINVYPNPATNRFKISDSSIEKIFLLDIKGAYTSLKKEGDFFTIPAEVSDGTYFILGMQSEPIGRLLINR